MGSVSVVRDVPLSGEKFLLLPLIVQTLDSAVHQIKIYSVDNAIGFRYTHPLFSV